MERAEWISVYDDMSFDVGEYVFVTDGQHIDIASFGSDKKMEELLWDLEIGAVNPEEITHWMPFNIAPELLAAF